MILIAPDKFKGTFTAAEICRLVAERLRKAGIEEPLTCRPLSDGGEGVASVFMPDGEPLAPGVYSDGSRRLVVSSEIIGHKAFENSGLPLMHRSSFVLGAAVDPRIPTAIAVGGTATADCGAGFLQALGARFFDHANRLISEPLTPSTLTQVFSADLSALGNYDIKGIIDVRASLTGPGLSALDFSRQKALPGEDLSDLKGALAHFSRIVGGESPWDGAGGGIGYALASVLKAPCFSGAEAAADTLNLDGVNLVFTGEGKVDAQTTQGGKLVDAVYRRAAARGIPTLILYGCRDELLPYPLTAQILSPWESIVQTLLQDFP